MDKFKLICPLITPLDASYSPSREYYRLLMSDLTEMGVNSIFPLGSTGLFSLLTMDKKKAFLNIVSEESQKKEIFIGIGSQNTEEAVELAKYAFDLGFTNMVLQPTYYIKPEQPWIIKHFSEVISKVEANFIIYNIPQLAGVSIETQTIESITDAAGGKIKGIKESSGNIRYFNDVIYNFGSKLPVYQGQDDLLLQSLVAGCSGGVCGSTNVSSAAKKVINLFTENDFKGAEEAQKNLDFVFRILSSYPFPSAYYYLFYRKHKVGGKIPLPITAMEHIPESFVTNSLDSMMRLENNPS